MDRAETDDAALLQLAQDGDTTAFDELVLRHQLDLRLFVARQLPDPEAVFEIVQETFIVAWRKRQQIDPERELAAWLRGVARRSMLDWFRRRARRRGRERQAIGEAVLALPDDTVGSNDSDAHHRRLAHLRRCLATLDQDQRQILDERYRQGEAVQDLAKAMDISHTALSMKLLRLRQRLRHCVELGLRQEGT